MKRKRISPRLVVQIPDEWDLAQRSRQFSKVCAENFTLFETKNEQYGDGIRFGGLAGAVVELIGCVLRLQTLVLANTTQVLDEDAILNALRDAHNYSVIAQIMLQSGNISGDPVALEEDEDA